MSDRRFVWSMKTYPLYLNGELVTNGQAIGVINPAIGEPFAKIATIARADVARAIGHAHAAFARVTALDELLTDYDPESELMRLSRAPRGEAVPVSDDEIMQARNALARAKEVDADFFDPSNYEAARRALDEGVDLRTKDPATARMMIARTSETDMPPTSGTLPCGIWR